MAKQSMIKTTAEKIAWLRCVISLSLPKIERACPEAFFQLAVALEETAPGLVDLAEATVEDLRSIEHDCALARPQAMGRAHLHDSNEAYRAGVKS